jgi:hypothetical protein
MPATSKAQQMAAGAELRRRRQGRGGKAFSSMSDRKLEHYASTSRKGLPYRKGRARKRAAGRMAARLKEGY